MVDLNRRGFLSGLRSSAKFESLPWAIPDEQFTELCTSCGACSDACPEFIVRNNSPAPPQIDFSHGECTFCYHCADACEEQLFSPRDHRPWRKVIELSNHCLAKQQVECRICSEECEQNAIRFIPTLGGVAQPHLSLESCTGCGACISNCPTDAIAMITPEFSAEEPTCVK